MRGQVKIEVMNPWNVCHNWGNYAHINDVWYQNWSEVSHKSLSKWIFKTLKTNLSNLPHRQACVFHDEQMDRRMEKCAFYGYHPKLWYELGIILRKLEMNIFLNWKSQWSKFSFSNNDSANHGMSNVNLKNLLLAWLITERQKIIFGLLTFF